MRRISYLAFCAVSLFAAVVLPLFPAQASPQAAPQRGIAVLSSSIGSDYLPEALAETVRQGHFSPVVIDWAWITYHWSKTNFPAVNRFLQLMAAQHVPVAAMYRPRFLNETPTVPTQVDASGKPVVSHGNYICFSSPAARQWGISWGTKILQQFPQINEIIIYNPLNYCQCPICREAAHDNPFAGYDAVWQFLFDAKNTWQKQKPGVKLGLVYVSDLKFWQRGTQIVDVAHPFLFVADDQDFAKDAAAASAVRNLLPGQAGSCLAKITWGATDKVSSARLAEFDRTAAQAGLPYFFWTAETLFDAKLYDQKAVAQILLSKPSLNTQPPPRQATPVPSEPGTSMYSPEAVRRISVQGFLDRMIPPEAGYQQFAAMNAIIQKGKESDATTRGTILTLLITTMNDERRPFQQRWQCCKILGAIGDERAVPTLIQLLQQSDSGLSGFAAESLAEFVSTKNNGAAHKALLQAAPNSPTIQEIIARHLHETVIAADGSPAPAGPNGTYTPEQARDIPTEVFLRRMLYPEPNGDTVAPMDALIQKAKESGRPARDQILTLVIKALRDKRNPADQRWQCCYVLSGSGDERVVPYLIPVLEDEYPTMRGAAADALAKFPRNTAAHTALLKAAASETDPDVRATLTRLLGSGTPKLEPSLTVPQGDEWAPTGPPKPPPGPRRPVAAPLPWPFPGDQSAQNIFNNYQQATDGYIHCGLDFLHPAGTPVTAVDSGYVRMIFTNYPEWITHYCFFISSQKGGNVGWCYTHIDPRTFPYKVGDYLPKGANLGSLVDFSVGDHPGVAHLHLQYGRLIEKGQGKADAHSLIDPLYFFAWKDTEAPVFQALRFVVANTDRLFPTDALGVVNVSGRVDIISAITDSAYPGHLGNIGMPVVMLSISDGVHTMQKLVVDHRGEVVNETQVKPLFLTWEEEKTFIDPEYFPRYEMMRVTKTDGDGQITPQDAAECWDTEARDVLGNPLWPNGRYSVNVYAWDISGNRASIRAAVQVNNQ